MPLVVRRAQVGFDREHHCIRANYERDNDVRPVRVDPPVWFRLKKVLQHAVVEHPTGGALQLFCMLQFTQLLATINVLRARLSPCFDTVSRQV